MKGLNIFFSTQNKFETHFKTIFSFSLKESFYLPSEYSLAEYLMQSVFNPATVLNILELTSNPDFTSILNTFNILTLCF